MFPAGHQGKDSVLLFTYSSAKRFKFVNILLGRCAIALPFKYLRR